MRLEREKGNMCGSRHAEEGEKNASEKGFFFSVQLCAAEDTVNAGGARLKSRRRVSQNNAGEINKINNAVHASHTTCT